MKNNQPVNNTERKFSNDTPLISTTDLKGQITFVNDAFVDISGFTREELIGQSHNVVRHPDVPPPVFGDLWSKLKENKPWIGIVKNRCKDGSYYWVNAYVTPIVESGRTIGYQSVRTVPTSGQVSRANDVYSRLNNNSRRISMHDMSIQTKIIILLLLAVLIPMGAGYFTQWSPMLTMGAGLGAFILCAGLSYHWLGPLRYLQSRAKRMLDSKVLEEMYANSVSEVGSIYLGTMVDQARIRSANARVTYSAKELNQQGEDTIGIARQANQAIERQSLEIEDVSAHIQNLSIAIEEVAQHARTTSEETKQATNTADQGHSIVKGTIDAIHHLAENVEQAAQQIDSLRKATEEIASKTSVISEIADQTNLLALNAAIEAARAGEQGRGFAVVADEVRELAKRTQLSTKEIDTTIAELQGEAAQAMSMMEKSQDSAKGCVDKAGEAGSALQEIMAGVGSIDDMSTMIAAASSQQSNAAEELKQNIMSIQEAAQVAQLAAQATERSSVDLADTSKTIVQSVSV
ncbi:methyl-accepting chemotaxis protein [Neptuniibacter sp. QD48_55]|uniref:methyl-accepting chemotaxis protein n=1 Tax=Neptuniibacter sp. QD48_55 TaxID=3398212 RepID=UPI0039F4A38A